MHIRRSAFLLTIFLLLFSAAAWSADQKPFRNDGIIQQVVQRMAEASVNGNVVQNAFVGTDACLACHPGYQDFKRTAHHTGLKMVRDDRSSLKVMDGIIADYDRNGVDDFKQGLDFNKINSAFDRFKPNAPILAYKVGSGYSVTIAGVEYPVVFTHGGTGLAKQRYAVRFPVTDRPSGWSADYYYLPIQYNDKSGTWVTYSTGNWYNADNTPKIRGPVTSRVAGSTGISFYGGCSGCHGSAVKTTRDALGEWISTAQSPVYTPPGEPHYLDLDGNGWPESFNVGCERCHGPGARHIVNLRDPKEVIQPARDFTPRQINALCGSCHTRGTSSAGSFGYPYDEARGEDYSTHLGKDVDSTFWRPNPTRWPDRKTPNAHRQQFNEMSTSGKGPGDSPKAICSQCHDPHRTSGRGQLRQAMMVTGSGGASLQLNVKVEDNTLCLACHAGKGSFAALRPEELTDPQRNASVIANVVTQHTRHPYRPEGFMGLSRCTECHMAKTTTNGDPYDVSSHTFEAISPQKTLDFQAQGGMPNSCAARCHRPLAPFFGLPADSSLTNWAETSDKLLAEWLARYHGPNGIWWKTNP